MNEGDDLRGRLAVSRTAATLEAGVEVYEEGSHEAYREAHD